MRRERGYAKPHAMSLFFFFYKEPFCFAINTWKRDDLQPLSAFAMAYIP